MLLSVQSETRISVNKPNYRRFVMFHHVLLVIYLHAYFYQDNSVSVCAVKNGQYQLSEL